MTGGFSRRAFLRGGLATTGFTSFASRRGSATQSLSNTIRIEADGGGVAAYEFTVSGSLRQEDSGDHVRGNRAYGHLGPDRGTDVFSYSGQLTGFVLAGPATVFRNGNQLRPDDVRHPAGAISAGDFPSSQGTNTLEIESQGGGFAVYEFTVTGSLTQVDQGDTVSGNYGYGHVGPERGLDEFRYDGDLSTFKLAGPASVFLNGTEVTAGQPPNDPGNQQPSQSEHELCLYAPNDRLYPYQFAVGGSISKLDAPSRANVDPNAVTADAEDDIDDCSCHGFTRGGWDCYSFTGDLLAFSVPDQWADRYDVWFDGRRTSARQLVTSTKPSEVSCDGTEQPDCRQVRNDIALVLDRSDSMNETAGKFNEAKTGAINLVDLSTQSDRVGLVSFADAARVDVGLTQDFDPVRASIQGLSAAGDTNLADGIARGRTQLEGGRPNATKIMVVLADGEHNTGGGDPRSAAARAKSAGIRVMTIGIPPLRDRSELREIASDPTNENFVDVQNVKSIDNAFETVVREICD